MPADFTFIGVPIDSVGRAGGTEHGPAKLRALGLADLLSGDAGDLDVRIRGEERDAVTGILGSPDVLSATVGIREATAAALTVGERPFLVGGCCTELPGALAAARDILGRTGVAYLDGHLDLSDGVTSPTGEAAVQTKGYSGSACLQASKFLEQALGVAAADVKTAEFYQAAQPQQQETRA